VGQSIWGSVGNTRALGFDQLIVEIKSDCGCFAIGRRSRVSAWPEYLRKKMECGEVAREEEEKEV